MGFDLGGLSVHFETTHVVGGILQRVRKPLGFHAVVTVDDSLEGVHPIADVLNEAFRNFLSKFQVIGLPVYALARKLARHFS